MPFYYLHPKSEPCPEPGDREDKFTHVMYYHSEIGRHSGFKLDGEKTIYCTHESLGKFIPEPIDDELEILGKHISNFIAKFKKVHESTGFTVWKRTDPPIK